ncbi:hypothetical protein [Malaciobacter canalis]|uniref:hypothetical protein n=1 Tax=Malaciobacter canalis TaxID=1912871 RepID=UPI00384DB9B3
MKKLLFILTTILLTITFSGCLSQNAQGLYIPSSKEDLMENKKLKVYFEDLTPIKTKEVLLNIKDFIEKSKVSYEIKFPEGIVHMPSKEKVFDGYNKNIPLFYYEGEELDYKALSKTTSKKINKPFNMKFNLESGVLVSTKKYDTYNEILSDMFGISLLMLDTYKNDPKFTSKFQTSFRLVLDEKAFKEKKLGITVLRKGINPGPILKEQLSTYGFTLVDNPDDADKVVLFQTSGTFTGDELDANKDIKLFTDVSRITNADSLGSISMNLTKLSGHSSLHSAQAGLAFIGVSVLFDVFFGGKSNLTFTSLNIIDKKEKKITNISKQFKTLENKGFYISKIRSYRRALILFLEDESKNFGKETRYKEKDLK